MGEKARNEKAGTTEYTEYTEMSAGSQEGTKAHFFCREGRVAVSAAVSPAAEGLRLGARF
jgi:hypothetical protein